MVQPPNPAPSRDRIRAEFDSVVREHRAPLVSFLRRYTGDEGAAHDLAQETFVKAYFHLDRFDDSRPFAPWLFTIAANKARDYVARRKPPCEPWDDEACLEAAGEATPAEILTHREDHAILESAVMALPLPLREPILLHYQLDWPIEAIARHLKLQPGAVKTRLHRARRALQTLLQRQPQ